MSEDSILAWLEDAARYFEARDTKGEDMAHWANVYNAEKCRKIAVLIEKLRAASHKRLVIDDESIKRAKSAYSNAPRNFSLDDMWRTALEAALGKDDANAQRP